MAMMRRWMMIVVLAWTALSTMSAQTELQKAAPQRAVPKKMKLDSTKQLNKVDMKLQPVMMKEAPLMGAPTARKVEEEKTLSM